LSPKPPFIWPEARWHAGISQYTTPILGHEHFSKADLVAGLIVDASDGFVEWLRRVSTDTIDIRIVIILVVYPACETKASHLTDLLTIKEELKSDKIEIKILPVATIKGIPPTVLQLH